MGSGCFCVANVDIAKMEAEVNERQNEQNEQKDKKTERDGSLNSATPEIPSVHSHAIKTNLEEVPNLSPVQNHSSITPLPRNEIPNMTLFDVNLDDDEMIDPDLSYSAKNIQSAHALNNSGTFTSENNEEYKIDVTFNSVSNEISLNICNDMLDKKWMKTLKTEDFTQDNNAMEHKYNQLKDIIHNGMVNCMEMNDGNCTINLLKNNNSYEFVVSESI